MRIFILIVLLGVLVVFWQNPPQVVEVTRVIEKPVIKEVVKEVPVIQIVETPKIVYRTLDRVVDRIVEKEVRVPIAVKPFQSLEELNTWLSTYEANALVWGGTINIGEIDCEDFTFGMIFAAMRDGYFLSTQALLDQSHMVAAAPIGNIMYYIEATPKGGIRPFKEVWFGYYLDDDRPKV